MSSTIQNVFKAVKSGLGIVVPLVSMLSVSQPTQAETYKVVDSETGKVVYTDKPQNVAKSESDTITVDKMAMQSHSQTTAPQAPHNIGRHPSNGRHLSNNRYTPNGYPSNNYPSSRNQRNNYPSNYNRPVRRPYSAMPARMNNHQAQHNNKVTPQTTNVIKKSPNYQVNIVNPAEARAYHKPAQYVNVKTSVTPKLKNGDYIIVLIDGKEMATGAMVNINTTGIEVGEHLLTATVIDKYGRDLASSSRKFHVLQRNVGIKKKREKAAAVANYQALPWYKKIAIKNPAKQAN